MFIFSYFFIFFNNFLLIVVRKKNVKWAFFSFKNNRKRHSKRTAGVLSTFFHSLWMCVAMLLHMTSKTMVEAVCRPSTKLNLIAAVQACLEETRSSGGTGICPIFSAASNGVGCNSGGVNGVMGDWDITRVTILSNLFENKKNFRADISKWDTKRVVDMSESTCASVAV